MHSNNHVKQIGLIPCSGGSLSNFNQKPKSLIKWSVMYINCQSWQILSYFWHTRKPQRMQTPIAFIDISPKRISNSLLFTTAITIHNTTVNAYSGPKFTFDTLSLFQLKCHNYRPYLSSWPTCSLSKIFLHQRFFTMYLLGYTSWFV